MNPLRVVILNPCLVTTPLNFRKWLRDKLDHYEKADVVKGERVTGILFLTKVFKGALGAKNLDKILKSVLLRRPWMENFSIVSSDKPLSDDEAQAFLDQVQNDYRIQEQMRELEERDPMPDIDTDEIVDTLLGYLPEHLNAEGAVDHTVEPVCVVRKARASDFEDTLKGSTSYAVGQWYVIGTDKTNEGVSLSPPFENEGDATDYAGREHGVSVFKQAAEIQLAHLQEQIEVLAS